MKKQINTYLNILFITVIAVIFTIPGFFRNFWWDESITLTDFIQLPYSEIYKQYAIANNHIIYTIFLKLWHNLTGNLSVSEFHFRILSFCTGIAALISSYLFLKKTFSNRTSLFVTLSFAVSSPFLIYATAVRGYMLSASILCITYFFVYNCFKRNSLPDYIVFFILSITAVGIMPTNLIGIYAVIFSIAPFFIDFKEDISKSKSVIMFFSNKKNLILLLTPPLAFILFYAPLFSKLLNILKNNSGAVSHLSSLLNLYITLFITFLPCFLLALFPLFNKNKKLETLKSPLNGIKYSSIYHRYFVNTVFMFLIFLLPVILIFSRTPAPFARIFFQLWPLFMFITAFYIETALQNLNEKNINTFTSNTVKYFPLIILLWGGLVLNITPVLSDTLFNSGINDDFLSPYYMHNFKPAQLVKDADALCKKNGYPVFVSATTDYPSINLYSATQNASKSFTFLYLPNKKANIKIPKDISFYYVTNSNENLKDFIRKYAVNQQLEWGKSYGIQALYFFSNKKD